jgi:O-antigen/teichoic acid export membrane protein
LTSVLALLNVRLDILLMSAFLGARSIGFYSIAVSAMLPIALVYTSATTLLLPSIAKARGTRPGDPTKNIALIRRTAMRYSLVALSVAIALAAVLPFALPLVFGKAFEPTVKLAWILIPGFIAQGYATMVDAGLVGMRKPWVGNVSQGAGVVITGALLPVLLPAYQATGAAITSSIAYMSSAAVAVWASARIYNKSRAAETLSGTSAVDR